MARISHLKPLIGTVGPLVKSRLDKHGHDETGHIRGWYKSAEWQKLRVRVFERDGYRCQWAGCGIVLNPKSKDIAGRPIADHKIRHRGVRALFFDDGNVWTLCKPHHDRDKQVEEKAADRGFA